MIAAVLRSRLQRLRNIVLPRRRSRGRLGAATLGMGVGVLLALMVTLALAALFSAISLEGAGARDAATALALILTATLVGLLVFDLHETVTTLLVDSDLDLLRRAPLSAPMLFAIKLIDALPRTSLLLIVLAVPSVIAFNAFFPLPLWAWLALPVQLLAMWAIPLGLGIAIALWLLSAVPARHAREGLGLLSTLVLFLLWLANSFLLPRIAATAHNPVLSIRDLLASVPPVYALSPGTWLASAIAAAAEGRGPEVVRSTVLLLIAGILSLVTAGVVAAMHLETVQLRLTTGSGRGRGRPRAVSELGDPAAPRGFIDAVLHRDGILLGRNWTVLGDLVTAAALWTLLPLVGRPLFAFTPLTVARTMLLALTVALGYEIAARAFPLERRGATWMRLAPVSAVQWVLARYAGSAMLAVMLLVFATVSITVAMRLGLADIAAVLAIVVPALALALAIGLWTGAAFGDPAWTNPRAMLTLTGRATATLALIGQAGAWIGVSALLDARPSWLPPATPFWVPAVAALVLVPAMLRATAHRIERTS